MGKVIAHPTSNNAHQFEGQRSKVKITTSTNVETVFVSVSYLPNGKTYELETWYIDGVQRSVYIADKLYDHQGQRSRSQGHMVRLTGVAAHKSRRKRPINTKTTVVGRMEDCTIHGQ